MNAYDILHYGNLTLLGTVTDLSEPDWDTAGVCGYWSVHDIFRHLASYEAMLVEILAGFTGPAPRATLDQYINDFHHFNDAQVAQRAGQSIAETVGEYKAAHAETLRLIGQIPAEKHRENGTLPWYGAAYSLEDFLVYTYYGHKREHSAQVMVFRDTLKT